jgi:peptide/nickel transport system substrate-binding protein
MAVAKQKWTILFAAVALIAIVGAYAYVASLPTPEQIAKKQTEAEFAAKQKEFQKTLTYVGIRNPRIFGWVHNVRVENRWIAKETYEGLTRYEDGSLDFKPCLAEKWEMSPDGKSYTFYLRKNVKFYPSGDPFNAQAVKFSYDEAFGPAAIAPVPLFGGLDWVQYDRCEVIDDYTVKIYIKRPLAWFMGMTAYVSVGGIMNPKWVAAHGGAPKSEREIDPYFSWHQDVTGPYIVDEFVAGDRIVLKRNPTYWMGWTGALANRPERIVFRIVPEPATRIMLLARGDADVGYVDLAYLPELENRIKSEKLPLVIDKEPNLDQLNIVFDHNSLPTSDVHIRKMLAWSFNYDSYIANVMNGYGVRMTSFIAPGMKGHMTDIPYYTFDLAKAKAELELASKEAQEMVKKEIKITYTTGYAIGKEGYLMWKADLAKIGVNLVLNEVAYQTYKDYQYGGGMSMLDRRWQPDFLDPSAFYMFMDNSYRVAQKFGTTPDWVDQLFEKAAFETNWEARMKIFRQLEEWAYENVPYIKVAHPTGGTDTNVRGSWVKGYSHTVMDDHKAFFWELSKELATPGKAPAAGNSVLWAILDWSKRLFAA